MSLVQANTAIVSLLTARDTGASDQGNTFKAVNPTPGTGIASAAAPTTLTETTPFLTIYNGTTLSQNIYLLFVRFLDTAASTGGTGINFTHSLDQGNRFSSGGTALTINNVNSASSNKSGAIVNLGALTASAKSAAQRNLGNTQFRPVIDQTGDKYEFQYGEGASGSVNPSDGTNKGHFVIGMDAVIIAPNWTYLINLWKGSMSAAVSVEVEIGWIER